MNGYAGAPQGQLYVRALYDYVADDRTSLSFQQGDIIQVITQLESGWWDGVIHGVRGWFPSNYCAVVNAPYDDGRSRLASDSEADESEEEYGDHELDHGPNGVSDQHAATNPQEEAAFWIPQATPDGRLFYFNTLTGESTMELPLEAPTSANETGPRDRTNVFIPDQTRPPAELMAGGYERDDDTDYASASETEEASGTRDSKGSSVSPAGCCRPPSCYTALTQTSSESAEAIVSVRRCVTGHVHGFSQQCVAVDALAHKSESRNAALLRRHAAGYPAHRYHHDLFRERACRRLNVFPLATALLRRCTCCTTDVEHDG